MLTQPSHMRAKPHTSSLGGGGDRDAGNERERERAPKPSRPAKVKMRGGAGGSGGGSGSTQKLLKSLAGELRCCVAVGKEVWAAERGALVSVRLSCALLILYLLWRALLQYIEVTFALHRGLFCTT